MGCHIASQPPTNKRFQERWSLGGGFEKERRCTFVNIDKVIGDVKSRPGESLPGNEDALGVSVGKKSKLKAHRSA